MPRRISKKQLRYWDKKFRRELGIPFYIIGGGKGRSKKRKAAEERALVPLREYEKAAAPTPEETERRNRTFDMERFFSPYLQGRLDRTGEQLVGDTGPIGSRLLELASQATQNPEQYFYSDVFKPNLELLRGEVTKQSARRGITPESGLTLENLGRTGLELAVQDALNRQQARVLGLTTGEEISNYANMLSQQARGEYAGFLGNQQSLSEAERNRALEGMGPRVGTQSAQHQATAQQYAGPSPWIGPAATALGGSLGFLIGGPPGAGVGARMGSQAAGAYTGGQQASSPFSPQLMSLLFQRSNNTPTVSNELASSRKPFGYEDSQSSLWNI